MMYKGSYLVFKLYLGVSLFIFQLEDPLMGKKPTYGELEQSIRSFEQERDQMRHLFEFFLKITRMADADYQALCDQILVEILNMTNSQYAFYGFLNENESVMTIYSWSRETLEACKVQDKPIDYPIAKAGIWANAVRERKPIVINDYNADNPGKTGLPEGHVKITRLISVPIFSHGRIVAIAAGANKESAYVDDDVRQVETFTTGVQALLDSQKAEEALRESEEKYRSLLDDVIDSSEVGLFILDPDFKVVWENQALERYFGLKKGEIIGKDKRQLILKQIKYKFEDPEGFAEKVLATYDNNTYIENFECHVLSDDKCQDRWLEHWSQPIRSGLYSGGRVELYYDINDRKRAEEALKDSEKRFRSIIEGTEAGYFFIDKDGIFQDVNEAWLRMHHYSSSDEVIGQHFSLTQIDSDMEAANKIVKRLLGGEPLPAGEFSRRCKDGSIGYHTFTVSPVVHGGEIIGLEGFIIDITDKKELETHLRQAHKMEAIGTLAGGIAHDFNNMLGIILGNTELAMDDVTEWNPARLNLEEIKTASLRAKDVVRQLLSFARKTDQERKPVKINPIVTGALKLLRSSIPTSIEIRSNIPRDSAIILADPTQINQIMINLCTNAAHAMEEDGGVLEISLDSMTLEQSTAQSYELSPGRYVKLTVNDTGHGIDPEINDRIFDPYFTTKEVGKGSGMGLAVVHGIVMNQDGAITVDSEVGKGTTLNVFLPIVEREPVPEITIDKDFPTGKERILFVDDEESIVKMGNQRLERLGYQVESTTSPLEALDLFRSKPDQFDLVITDLTMPKMTGDKLVKEILKIRPDILIILCTGFSEKMDGEKARAIGASGYLEKPHEKHDLAKMVRKVLDGK